jgi:hypothetical protein
MITLNILTYKSRELQGNRKVDYLLVSQQIYGLLRCIETTNNLSRAATVGSPYKEKLFDFELSKWNLSVVGVGLCPHPSLKVKT